MVTIVGATCVQPNVGNPLDTVRLPPVKNQHQQADLWEPRIRGDRAPPGFDIWPCRGSHRNGPCGGGRSLTRLHLAVSLTPKSPNSQGSRISNKVLKGSQAINGGLACQSPSSTRVISESRDQRGDARLWWWMSAGHRSLQQGCGKQPRPHTLYSLQSTIIGGFHIHPVR